MSDNIWVCLLLGATIGAFFDVLRRLACEALERQRIQRDIDWVHREGEACRIHNPLKRRLLTVEQAPGTGP